MSNTICPHCEKETITPAQRLKNSHWLDTYCTECGGRMAMQPIVLALLHFALVWDIYFFGFMAIYEKSIAYAAAMIVGWLILEFFAYYIPLVRLRPKKKTAPSDG